MLIEVNEISKIYRTKLSLIKSQNESLKAVNNVSFNIDIGEVVGLVGESGCGKSTLSRLMMRLERPTEGKIKFMGKDIWNFKGEEIKGFRKSCQIIFQDTMTSLNPNIKVIDSLLEPLNNHYNSSREEKIKRIENIISFANLKNEILEKYPLSISGGERQRINICRALLLKPKFLICDEIISSLDVCTQAVILNMIKDLININKMGVLFISHDISAVKYLCSRIMVMYKGSIIETINNRDRFYEFHNDYTKQLIAAVPINNPNKRIEI